MILDSKEEVLEWATWVRGAGQFVVMTNGCFDILHAGHIRYLAGLSRDFAGRGRVLLALNDDKSFRKHKGRKPKYPLRDRLEIMCGLRYVDAVTYFSQATPIPLIKSLMPEILAKGGDYTPEEVVGHQVVEKYGGVVHVGEHLAGRSTSKTLRRRKSPKR